MTTPDDGLGVGVAHVAILIAVVALVISVAALIVATGDAPTSDEFKEAGNSTTDPWDNKNGGTEFGNPWFLAITAIACIMLMWKIKGPGM